MKTYLTPAEVAISAFGSAGKLGRAIGRDHSAVSKWAKKKSGAIPQDAIRLVYEKACERGIELKPEELILGREISA